MTPSGVLTKLHSCNYTDGANPGVASIQASDGNFYGPTDSGRANVYHGCGGYCGTIYSLSVGLPAFVEAQ